MPWWLSSARSKRREVWRYPYAEAGFVQPPDASKKSIVTGLDDNMVSREAEALRADKSAVADVLCGCAFCLPIIVRTDGLRQ